MDNLAIATLQLRTPDGREQLIRLRDGDSMKVGRDAGNDIVLADSGVSRVHASFSCSSYGVVVADLASTNGTFLNGKQISSMRDLSSNDLINMGQTSIRVIIHSADSMESLSSQSSARAMTTQLKPVSVTVLALRIKNHQQLIDGIGLPSTQIALDKWHSQLQVLIENRQGKIDKIIDSALVALWVGTKRKVQAELAVQAADAIRLLAEDFAEAEGMIQSAEVKWEISLVLSSGQGLGAGASNGMGNYTIVGDPVNEAFRVLSMVENVDTPVVIDEATADLVKDSFPLKPLDAEGIEETLLLFDSHPEDQ